MVNHASTSLLPDRWRAAVIGALLLAAALAAAAVKGEQRATLEPDRLRLTEIAPPRFHDWVAVASPAPMPAPPAAEDGRPYPYSQELSTTYRGPSGELVTLTLAYGRNQLDQRLHAHRPEYCYQAQGFDVAGRTDERLAIPNGSLPVRRFHASLRGRNEPVTYWMTVGEAAVLPGWSRTMAQVRHGVRASIPDGMLVRVSSHDAHPRQGYDGHDRFIREWLANMSPHHRMLLGGGD